LLILALENLLVWNSWDEHTRPSRSEYCLEREKFFETPLNPERPFVVFSNHSVPYSARDLNRVTHTELVVFNLIFVEVLAL
jgi:hypothetical protein